MRCLLITLLALALAPVGSARAAEPGANGLIAYADNYGYIRTINPDGTTMSAPLAIGYGPAWSADGRHIAYMEPGPYGNELLVMDADGANKHVVKTGIGHLDQPTWSPDGTTLAYTERVNLDRDIYTVEIASGHTHRLTVDGHSTAPDWGAHNLIAYATDEYGKPALFTMAPDGAHKTAVRNSPVTLEDPDWRAGVLAYTYEPGNNLEVFVDGRQFTFHPAADEQPIQAPDGSGVAFLSDRAGTPAIYVEIGAGPTHVAYGFGPFDWQSVPRRRCCWWP